MRMSAFRAKLRLCRLGYIGTMDGMPHGSFQQWLAVVVLLLAAAIGSFVLFVPPAVGMADQGDFARVLPGAGLKYPASVLAAPRPYFCFANLTYQIVPLQLPDYVTSELAFTSAARIVRRLVGRAAVFDARVLGAVHLLALLVAFALLLRCASGLTRLTQCMLGALLLLIGCDIGYLAYFNSFYSESATYLFGLAFIAAVILLVNHPAPSRPQLVAVFLTLVLFVAAKVQNLPVLLATVPFLAISLRRVTPRSGEWRAVWVLGVLAMSAWLSVGGVVLKMNYKVRMVNLYNSIFLQVLPYSPSPAEDLVALGLDPRLSAYAGQSAFSVHSVVGDPASFPRQASYARLVEFYLARPRRLLALTSRGVRNSLSNRVPLGNFERAVGRPCTALSKAFSLWDSARKRLHSLWFMAVFLLANIAAPWWLSARAANPRTCVLLQFQAVMASAGVLMFYTAILGDGNEFQKHLFIFNFLFDCCLVADVLWITERAAGFCADLAQRRGRHAHILLRQAQVHRY